MEMNGGSSRPHLACTPYFLHCLIGVETEGLLDYQGWAVIISIVRWNLRLVIFGVDFNSQEKERNPKFKLCEEVGAKKLSMSLEKPRKTKLFCWISWDSWRDIPGTPETFDEKKACSIFGPYSRVAQKIVSRRVSFARE